MAGQGESVDANQSEKLPRSGSPNRWSRVHSWKVLLPSLILGLLLLFIAISIPCYRRLRALQALGEHDAVYSLRDEDDWLSGPAVAFGRVERVIFRELSDESLTNIAMLNEVTDLRGNVVDAPVTVTQEGISALKSLSHLQDLYIVGPGFSDDLLADWFSARPPLRSVEVNRTGADANALHELSQIPSLARLDLFSETLTDEDFETLDAYFGLQELTLNGPLLGDHSAEWLSSSSHLQSLHLTAPHLTDRGMECISRLPELQSLLLWECPEVTDTGIAHLESMKHLQLLCISVRLVTAASVESMLRIPSLQHVHVAGSIDNADLRTRLSQKVNLMEFGSDSSLP